MYRLLAIFTFLLLGDHLYTISAADQSTSEVHIVYMGEKPNGESPEATKKSHHEMLSVVFGSRKSAKNSILYSYKHGFSGFAAKLTFSEAEKIAEFPGVIQVFPSRIHKLHTTRSWDSLGLHHLSSSTTLLSEGNMGNGTIIGVIDTGVWPESESYSDEGMGPVPSHWKGICQSGELFNRSNCNKKLIGARWFINGQKPRTNNYPKSKDFMSARDSNGHGTHTASTAAGRFVNGANYDGLASGVARGGAPLARLAIYKVCWFSGECSDADILKAFDKAIYDGVDVLSVSIGISVPLFSYVDQRDSISIGSFHATRNGITVVSSGGNDGPYAYSVANTAPWLITVGASTIDRTFPTSITLGNNQILKVRVINKVVKKINWKDSAETEVEVSCILQGQSLDSGKLDNHGFSGIVYSERIALDPYDDESKDCEMGSLNATLASGKVVLCFSTQDKQSMVAASLAVIKAGGIGVIYAHFSDDSLVPCDSIPCVRVDYEVGMQILSYIRRARLPSVKLGSARTVIGETASPRIAYFSSRGPSSISPSVLKPDIVAPGESILAAYPPKPPLVRSSTRSYMFLSGTSMACPHVAGIVALIKSAHPDWSPAAIRSSLVTTATQKGTDEMEITEIGLTRKVADPFDMGGGLVNPNIAVNPGLIYNITTQEYIQFLCALSYSSWAITRLAKTTTNCAINRHESLLNLNLPSITIPSFKNNTTVTRTVTNVGDVVDSIYRVVVEAPRGVEMAVEPNTLQFDSGIRIITFRVTFLYSDERKVSGDYRFGSLTWTDGEHFVRSPVSLRVMI